MTFSSNLPSALMCTEHPDLPYPHENMTIHYCFGQVVEGKPLPLDSTDMMCQKHPDLAYPHSDMSLFCFGVSRKEAQRIAGMLHHNDPTRYADYNSVNHPQHYNTGKYEVIDVIEDWQLGFHLGNAVKYIARAGKKPTSTMREDLEKAIWYIQRVIDQKDKDPGALLP